MFHRIGNSTLRPAESRATLLGIDLVFCRVAEHGMQGAVDSKRLRYFKRIALHVTCNQRNTTSFFRSPVRLRKTCAGGNFLPSKSPCQKPSHSFCSFGQMRFASIVLSYRSIQISVPGQMICPNSAKECYSCFPVVHWLCRCCMFPG